jgi:hypothetical protein
MYGAVAERAFAPLGSMTASAATRSCGPVPADERSVARRMRGTRMIGAGIRQIVAMNPWALEAAAVGDRGLSVRSLRAR